MKPVLEHCRGLLVSKNLEEHMCNSYAWLSTLLYMELTENPSH